MFSSLLCLALCQQVATRLAYPKTASMEYFMSTFDSMGSPDFEWDDYEDSSMAASLHCWVDDKLHISDSEDVAGLFTCQNGDSSLRGTLC
jgi:hypothetical protein